MVSLEKEQPTEVIGITLITVELAEMFTITWVEGVPLRICQYQTDDIDDAERKAGELLTAGHFVMVTWQLGGE